MNILEFHDFKLSDAVKFHNKLNPALFDGTTMDPAVRDQLLRIAKDFVEYLGLDDLDIKDITVSGSNAGYTYTPHSDIDLHIVVDVDNVCHDDVYKELFTAKKNLYNDKHDIKVHGYDVELYVQDKNQSHVNAGEYSVLRNRWNKLPVKRAASLKEKAARIKFQKLVQLAAVALKSTDETLVQTLLDTIKKYRKAGLDEKGELGPENLAFKAFRSQGIIQQLYDHLDHLHGLGLSIEEELDKKEKPKSWDDYGVSLPEPKKKQEEKHYSGWDEYFNDTNKRDDSKEKIKEASGYIPSEQEKNDPRFKTALTVDVHPNTMKKGVKAMGLGNISRAGIPQTASPSGKFKR